MKGKQRKIKPKDNVDSRDDRIRELEDDLIEWQVRAQTIRVLHSRSHEKAERLGRELCAVRAADSCRCLPDNDILAGIARQAGTIAGKHVVCQCCPDCSVLTLEESPDDTISGFRLCDECAAKNDNWVDGWGIKWGREGDGQFFGRCYRFFQWTDPKGGDKPATATFSLATRED